MDLFLALLVFVSAILVFDLRGRVKAQQARIMRIEEELQRLRAAASQSPVTSAVTPQVVETAAPPVIAAPKPPVAAPVIAPPPAPPPPATAIAPSPQPQTVTVSPASTQSAPPPRKPARPAFSINFEELFGGKLPIWGGGIALAIAGVLMVKLGIDTGWFARNFTPTLQVLCGAAFGFLLIGGAELAHRARRRVDDPRVAQALSGAGISTLYAALLVAANAYNLISPLTAFIGMAAVTGMALALSLRHGAPSALLGLAGGLAAPALTMGLGDNVPMLAIYLGFTIAALTAVAQAKRWPWLALTALIGGAGWSLWLIIASRALDTMAALSVGGLVLLMAIAAPLYAFDGARATLLRIVSALVGALQLALLVAMGGFTPLVWGLFALIAAAIQWLAWRDAKLAIAPTISAAISAALLLMWPDPSGGWLLTIGLALAAIHAGPLIARMWSDPPRPQRAIELTAIALVAPLIALRHSWDSAATMTLVASLGALALLATAALGWNKPGRAADTRFAWLIGGGAAALTVAAWFVGPTWLAPLLTGLVAAAALWLARPAGDRRLEPIAGGFGLFAAVLLLGTFESFGDVQTLFDGAGPAIAFGAVLRWLGLAVIAAVFVWRADRQPLRDSAGALGAGLAYGAAAQVLPMTALPLVAPLGALALAAITPRLGLDRTRAAIGGMAAIAACWAALPTTMWINDAALSLIGMPMLFRAPELAIGEVARRLFIPALVLGGGLYLLRGRFAVSALLGAAAPLAAVGLIAMHCFYRAGFAAAFGGDFVATGLAQRLVWDALILALAWLLWKRGGGAAAQWGAAGLVGVAALHLTWYSLLLHNPLWNAQAVGSIPLLNLLAPLFAGLPLCVWLAGRMVPAIAPLTARALQGAAMVMAAMFAWASLRQAFHGSLLVEPGLGPTEDILRSILGIALAVGYLLWGIRKHRRDWRLASLVLMLAAVIKVFLFDAAGLDGLLRIASFIALGLSLIGIGWLYSRQLHKETAPPAESTAAA